MAVAKVNKVVLACHKEEKDKLLSLLQREEIIHINKTKESERRFGEDGGQLADLIKSAEEAITFLEQSKSKERKSIKRKIVIGMDALTLKENLPALISEVRGWKEEMRYLEEREKEIEQEILILKPFIGISAKIEDLHSFNRFETIFGSFPSSKLFGKVKEESEKKGFFIKEVSQKGSEVFFLAIALKEEINWVKDFLSENNFTQIDLKKFRGAIEENLRRRLEEKESIEKKKGELAKRLAKSSERLAQSLKMGVDYYQNIKLRQEVENYLWQTKSSFVIEGWIKERDYKRLASLINKFPSATLARVKPEPGEEPPVALENKKPFQPFELVVSLYGMPSYQEIDPTPYLAPFFLIFFALCLSDAAYGIIMLFLSLFLIRKFKKAKNFFILLSLCSVFTIFAGAVTNSWFGDILERIGIPCLKSFKDRLVLFDPFKNPLTFFYLSIGLGYIHLNYGLLLEVYDSFRIKNPLPALFNELPWFLLLNSLVASFFLSKTLPNWQQVFLSLTLISAAGLITLSRFLFDYLPRQLLFFSTISSLFLYLGFKIKFLPWPFIYFKYLFFILFFFTIFLSLWDNRKEKRLTPTKILPALLSLSFFLGYAFRLLPFFLFLIVGIFAVFLSKINRSLLKKFIWGAYNLYGGTSFIGIILSYIRLMALGMMTAGIGMAVNSIAWMVKDFPVLGIILFLLVLLIGHTYNIAVSILGAFVHTLRLNYVEFFPRFFTGGGEKFSPFKLETKYVELK